jgi:Flp pilus assembly protein TadB
MVFAFPFAVKSLFYSVFFAICAVFLANLTGFVIHFFTQRYLKKELFRNRLTASLQGHSTRFLMTGACFAALGVGLIVSYILFGRVIYGLLVVFMFPLVMRAVGYWMVAERRHGLDTSSISFLYALQGLVKVGVSMPRALFQISQTQEGPFAESFSKYLDRFDEGESLTYLIQRFRLKSGLGFSGVFFSSLEMAHRKGLSVAPLLEHMIPLLEAESQTSERVRSLRKSIAVQVLITFFLPWGVLLSLFYFQPEMWSHVATQMSFWALVTLSLLYECIGCVILWIVSDF